MEHLCLFLQSTCLHRIVRFSRTTLSTSLVIVAGLGHVLPNATLYTYGFITLYDAGGNQPRSLVPLRSTEVCAVCCSEPARSSAQQVEVTSSDLGLTAAMVPVSRRPVEPDLGPPPYNPGDFPNASTTVRGVEIGIVLLVLAVWVAAIALFFNRWGKIRMLLPYQPDYKEQLKVPGSAACAAASSCQHHAASAQERLCSQVTIPSVCQASFMSYRAGAMAKHLYEYVPSSNTNDPHSDLSVSSSSTWQSCHLLERA